MIGSLELFGIFHLFVWYGNTNEKMCFCKDEIKEYMVFVLIRDVVNRRSSIREICGRCGIEIKLY